MNPGPLIADAIGSRIAWHRRSPGPTLVNPVASIWLPRLAKSNHVYLGVICRTPRHQVELRQPGIASDLEEQLDSLLRSHGQNDLWQLAADLARKSVKPEMLESLFAILDADTARAALVRIAASVEIANLLNEIESSAARISDLVCAIKEYTYMDQAPVQDVDVVRGLNTAHNVQDVDVVRSIEATLTILNHKLKHGVTVKRDYQPVPQFPRFAGIF